jgi:hypothetical protein
VPLILGLDAIELVSLLLTFFVTLITFRVRTRPRDDGGGAPGDLRRLPVPGAGAVRRVAHASRRICP